MATNSLLVKVLILYFGINLLLFAGGVRLTDTTIFSDLVFSSNANASITDNNVQYGAGTLSDQTPNVNVDNGSASVPFIDVVGAVRLFVNFVSVLFGGIFIVFLLFPPVIQLFVGAPLGLLAIIGTIYFVRSGQ